MKKPVAGIVGIEKGDDVIDRRTGHRAAVLHGFPIATFP